MDVWRYTDHYVRRYYDEGHREAYFLNNQKQHKTVR